MPQPNDHVQSFPVGVSITRVAEVCTLSPVLTDLLVTARQDYDWPAGTGAAASQARIIALEGNVCRCLTNLNRTSAHEIVVTVSHWAGNNANSHRQILNATTDQQETMQRAISDLVVPTTASRGIDTLSSLPGISLVIASKIYRFCCPTVGASVDRHASYFFNSLRLNDNGFTTHFLREWANGAHTSSRLAIYQNVRYTRNRTEYIQVYLPLLACISSALNSAENIFQCQATGIERTWTPADIEMAAYYWWACNGAK